ncbi:hypothetical protein J2T09_001113 [Neorhizobium huautlense]|uniref:Uncharacterized protein n=1 Tax=Neorhizobium huautlense TaxID=67774 RepID=A0ABT9PPJ1_9HYPH|nr:DUF5682 family protein [Neorhizobium huautlense]MDP9836369.1 hypothetical protein [Neorhizobium huautlense]
MRLGIFSRREAEKPHDRTDRLTVIGVRHHSPACARLVAETITRLRPAYVLIEGPADFNPHIDDLRLPHQLPVAIFSFHATPERTFASYSPFCSYSPEWEALQTAWKTGATPLFCDLPAWHPDFGDRANRYADPHSARATAADAALGKAMGEDGLDAVWDALAEQAPAPQLAERLHRYFDLLRPEGIEDPKEHARENFMAAHAAWALDKAKNGKVVLVCGGWHAEAIRRLTREMSGDKPDMPMPAEGERAGSYVLPYEYQRLDRFTGYASGMPSPAYYEHVRERGLDAAADWAGNAIAAAMRASGQVVSTADRIAWQTHALALSRTRGHAAILRADLLDSALATVVKDGLEAPAAWTQAGAVRAGTHPALVAMLKAMTGDRRGRIAAGTRRPPLLDDVDARLEQLDLIPQSSARKLELDWNVSDDRSRAQALHALRLLKMPGLEQLEGPSGAETKAPRDVFRLVRHRDAEGMLIEASRWGGTLPMAAASLLADRVSHAGDRLPVLSSCLSDALFAGLLALETDLTAKISSGLGQSRDIGQIGGAGLDITRLYRFGSIFGRQAHLGLGQLCEHVFSRVLWLVDAIRSEEEGRHVIHALIACRDMIRDCPDLDIDRDALLSVLGRCLANRETAPTLAGAALGLLVACGRSDAASIASHMRHFSRPSQLGDFLSGLFALSREEIADDLPVIDAVAQMIEGWSDEEFLLALPALRQAFAFFPPREREKLAQAVLRNHGRGDAQAQVEALQWMRQRSDVGSQAAAMALEAAAARRLKQAGLF